LSEEEARKRLAVHGFSEVPERKESPALAYLRGCWGRCVTRAQGVKEWGRLKRALEDAEGRELSDRVLHEILHQLRSHSIIDEENNFTDPVVRRAALQL